MTQGQVASFKGQAMLCEILQHFKCHGFCTNIWNVIPGVHWYNTKSGLRLWKKRIQIQGYLAYTFNYCSFPNHLSTYRWVRARKTCLRCLSNGVTSFLHQPIDMRFDNEHQSLSLACPLWYNKCCNCIVCKYSAVIFPMSFALFIIMIQVSLPSVLYHHIQLIFPFVKFALPRIL